MRSLKLKTIVNVPRQAVHTCLQNPAAELGEAGCIRTVEITDIPDNVADDAVVRAWDRTSDVTWIGNDLEYRRHSYRFDEIGEGRIIR